MSRIIIQLTLSFEDITLEEASEAAQQIEQNALKAIHWKLAEDGSVSTAELEEVMSWYGTTVLVPRNLKDGTVSA